MDEKLTIVGPEPSTGREKQRRGNVHVEALMLMAKYDDGFRELLLSDRVRALDESGIEFTPTERMVLQAVGRDQLELNIEKFAIPGVTKKSIANWRAAASVMVLVTSILFGFESCASIARNNAKAMIERSKEGWIDDDTYRLSAGGAPRKILTPREILTDKEERRQNAKLQAIRNAQYQCIEKFKGYLMEAAGGILTSGPAGLNAAEELKKAVKSGKVIAEWYDEEDNCLILYEVKEKWLMKYVMTAQWEL